MSSTKLQSWLTALALTLISGSLTYLVVRDGVGVSEDPVFQNGSYLISNFFADVGPNQRGTLAEGLRALVFPYGFVSFLLELVNVEQTSVHFRVQLFAHILLSATFSYLTISRFANRQIALSLTLIAISTQAYYEQFLYSIGSAQLSLAWISIRLVYPQPAKVNSRLILLITLGVLGGTPLWSNLPQLTATVIFSCTIFVIALITHQYKIRIFQVSLLLGLIAILIYLPFAIFSLQEFEAFRRFSLSVSQSEFRNASARYVLQGAGKWSLLDESWKVPRYIYDENLVRQLLRLSLPVFVVASLLIKRRRASLIGVFNYLVMTILYFAVCGQSNYDLRICVFAFLMFSFSYLYPVLRFAGAKADSRDHGSTRMLEGLVALTLLVFAASLVGWFETYWSIRRTTALLTAFREPWAKFSQLYVLMLMCCVAFLLSAFHRLLPIATRRAVHLVLGTSLVAMAINSATVFFHFSPSYHTKLKYEFRAPNVTEWDQFDRVLRDAMPFLDNGPLCIINQDPRLLGMSIVRNMLPTDLNLADNCRFSNRSEKILFLNYSKALGISTEFHSLSPDCLLFTEPEMVVISSHCIVQSNWPSTSTVSLVEKSLNSH